MTFWLNGVFQNQTNAIDIADRGFLLADGLFETLRIINGRPLFFERHMSRLHKSAAALKINIPFKEEIIRAAIEKLVGVHVRAGSAASARITLTRGVGDRGLGAPSPEIARSTVLITAEEAPSPAEGAAKIMVSRHRRCAASFAARHKTLNYIDNIMARMEAGEAGADDAVMLNEYGRVACASAANIFVITSDLRVVTPPLEDGALPGVVRAVLLEAATRKGVGIAESSLDADALQGGLCFLTNSLVGVRRARLAGRQAEASGAACDILNVLKSCYAEAVKKEFGCE